MQQPPKGNLQILPKFKKTDGKTIKQKASQPQCSERGGRKNLFIIQNKFPFLATRLVRGNN